MVKYDVTKITYATFLRRLTALLRTIGAETDMGVEYDEKESKVDISSKEIISDAFYNLFIDKFSEKFEGFSSFHRTDRRIEIVLKMPFPESEVVSETKAESKRETVWGEGTMFINAEIEDVKIEKAGVTTYVLQLKINTDSNPRFVAFTKIEDGLISAMLNLTFVVDTAVAKKHDSMILAKSIPEAIRKWVAHYNVTDKTDNNFDGRKPKEPKESTKTEGGSWGIENLFYKAHIKAVTLSNYSLEIQVSKDSNLRSVTFKRLEDGSYFTQIDLKNSSVEESRLNSSIVVAKNIPDAIMKWVAHYEIVDDTDYNFDGKKSKATKIVKEPELIKIDIRNLTPEEFKRDLWTSLTAMGLNVDEIEYSYLRKDLTFEFTSDQFEEDIMYKIITNFRANFKGFVDIFIHPTLNHVLSIKLKSLFIEKSAATTEEIKKELEGKETVKKTEWAISDRFMRATLHSIEKLTVMKDETVSLKLTTLVNPDDEVEMIATMFEPNVFYFYPRALDDKRSESHIIAKNLDDAILLWMDHFEIINETQIIWGKDTSFDGAALKSINRQSGDGSYLLIVDDMVRPKGLAVLVKYQEKRYRFFYSLEDPKTDSYIEAVSYRDAIHKWVAHYKMKDLTGNNFEKVSAAEIKETSETEVKKVETTKEPSITEDQWAKTDLFENAVITLGKIVTEGALKGNFKIQLMTTKDINYRWVFVSEFKDTSRPSTEIYEFHMDLTNSSHTEIDNNICYVKATNIKAAIKKWVKHYNIRDKSDNNFDLKTEPKETSAESTKPEKEPPKKVSDEPKPIAEPVSTEKPIPPPPASSIADASIVLEEATKTVASDIRTVIESVIKENLAFYYEYYPWGGDAPALPPDASEKMKDQYQSRIYFDKRFNLFNILAARGIDTKAIGFSAQVSAILRDLQTRNKLFVYRSDSHNPVRKVRSDRAFILFTEIRFDGDIFTFPALENPVIQKEYEKFRFSLYLSRNWQGKSYSENDTLKLFAEFIDKCIAAKIKSYDVIRSKSLPEGAKPEETIEVEDEGELESFKKQMMFVSRRLTDPDIMDEMDDILNYFEGNNLRICRKCHYRLNNDQVKLFNLYSYIFNKWNSPTRYVPSEKLDIINELDKTLSKDIDFDTTKTVQDKLNDLAIASGSPDIAAYTKVQNDWRDLFNCPECAEKRKKRVSIYKDGLFYSGEIIWEILFALKNQKSTILVGNPGDGKSAIALTFLQWSEWRYGYQFNILNVDESTTSYTLRGGFSPSSLALGEEKIKFGVLSRSLLKLGSKEDSGRNLFVDEINRTDFRNVSFLMGFFETPFSYSIEETAIDEKKAMEFANPNATSDGFAKWIFIATMNYADAGNEQLSRAYKSRFQMPKVKYTNEQILAVLGRILNGVSDNEQSVISQLLSITNEWVASNEVLFPVGIRHLRSFFRQLRMGVFQVLNKKFMARVFHDFKGYAGYSDRSSSKVTLTKEKIYQLTRLVEKLLISLIVVPLVDESSKNLVENLEEASKNIASSIVDKITADILENKFNYFV